MQIKNAAERRQQLTLCAGAGWKLPRSNDSTFSYRIHLNFGFPQKNQPRTEMQMSLPHWLQANSYRVLRLSANATLSDSHKAASSMRRMVLLKMVNISETDVPALGEVPRCETDIRASIGRLENPSHRIADRLFWFHADDFHAGIPKEGRVSLQKAASEHDDALRALFQMYTSATLLSDGPAVCTESLRMWHKTIHSENYWKLSSVLDQLGGFEPRASTDELEALRGNAMMMAAEPLLTVGRRAVANDDRQQLQRVLAVLRDLSDSGDWTVTARQEILAPLVNAVPDYCNANRKIGEQIIRKAGAAAENHHLCDEALRHYRTMVERSLTKLSTGLSNGDGEFLWAREAAARCLSDIAADFTWADRYIEAEELYKEALRLAGGTLAAVEIERRFTTNKTSAARQRLYEALTPDAMEAMKSVEGLCQSIFADGRAQIIREPEQSDHNKPICCAMLARFRGKIQPALQYALAAIPQEHPAATKLRADVALCLDAIATDFTWADEFVLSLQLSQEALSIAANTSAAEEIAKGIDRVSENARQQRIVRELVPLKSAPSLWTMNGIGTKLYGSTDHDAASNSFATTLYFTFLFFPVFPLQRYRVIQNGNSYRFLGKLPLRKFDKWHIGIALALIFFAILSGSSNSVSTSQSQHNTYYSNSASVPSDSTGSSSSKAEIKAQIDAGRARMDVLKGELDPVRNELGSLKPQIKELDSEIKVLADRRSSGEAIDIHVYNSKVSRYNQLVAQWRALYKEHKVAIDEFNNLVKQDDELVARYKALRE